VKLLICCERYRPSVGGVQEVMRQVAERLAEKGHQVSVATSPDPGRPQIATVSGVTVRSYAISGNTVTGMTGEVARFQHDALSGQYDAILIKAAQQWSFDALVPILSRLSARKVFIPCGFSALSDPRYREYFREMPRWLACFHVLIFYSHHYRDIEFARRNGLKNISVITNGVDEREFGTLSVRELKSAQAARPLLILSVGSLIVAKGHWEVAKAFGMAKFEGPTRLVINGNRVQKGLLGMLRRAWSIVRARRWPLAFYALAVRVASRGAKTITVCDLPRGQLLELYAAADLFVFASKVEYSPLVLFESVAAGTPFLSAPVGNAREIAELMTSGVVYEARQDSHGNTVTTPRVLAREMERLTRSRAELRELGLRGREELFKKPYTWSAIVKEYEKVLFKSQEGECQGHVADK
jgi:glycosyltransferase involved in cell wall biosynthesis